LSEFWREKLTEGREAVRWEKVLRLLVVNRLLSLEASSACRHWFAESAMDTLLEEDFSVADKGSAVPLSGPDPGA
jgi:hypothetical protein